jgi:flavin reductase (DIM6/NTAB) family NADH-FMN oxidoreductase RutF
MTMSTQPSRYVPLNPSEGIWDAFYTLAPLVLVGTIEPDGSPDIAPKHQAMPLGHGSLFGFVCSNQHATYRNAVARGSFTVGFPSPEMVVQTSLAAAPRDAHGDKPTLDLMSLSPAHVIDGVLVDGCRVHLECGLDRVVDDLDGSSLVVGRVLAAYASERVLRDRADDGLDGAQTSPLLAYVHPGRVAAVHQTKEFPYHRGFHD